MSRSRTLTLTLLLASASALSACGMERGTIVPPGGYGSDPAAEDDGGSTMDPPIPGELEDPAEDPMATPPDPPVEEIAECRAVDVLFVIDDSGSMADQQASLIASFDGFVAGMREELGGAPSLHVGVVTTDAYRDNEAGCREIGDLVTETGSIGGSNRACGPFVSGGRYLTQDDDLSTDFACVAQVGTGGDDDERAARAVLNAIDPSRPCNAGFIREDALLVVVIITDEDDVRDGCSDDGFGERCESYGSGGRGDEWLAELSTIRDPESVVMMTLLGERLDNSCGAVVAARLLGFARRFGESGHVGDVCAESYDEFFREALPIIGEACVNLI